MYSIQENDHQTKPQIYKKKKRFHGKTNLNITKFLVHKVGGAKWPDSRRNSAAYRPLMTTLITSYYYHLAQMIQAFVVDPLSPRG